MPRPAPPATMTSLRLDDARLLAYDEVLVQEAWWTWIAAALRRAAVPATARILDVGGGNGVFLDRLLALLPRSTGVNLDLATGLLARNRAHPRKRLLYGDLGDYRLGAAGPFDLISCNWVLHHLVAGELIGICF